MSQDRASEASDYVRLSGFANANGKNFVVTSLIELQV